jgi:glycerophosphoryl diester phosphodiesterase
VNVVLDPSAKPVIAHRGGRARGPENTLEAMRVGVADGADAIELDVHLSADDDVVVIHDATVDRTTDGTGPVAGMTWADLRSLDAGCRFRGDRSAIGGECCRIPSLSEVLESFPGIPLIIELKTPAASIRTRALIEKHRAEKRCLVDSFHAEALLAFDGSRIARGPSRDGLVGLIARALLPIGGSASVRPAAICIPRRYRGFPLPVKRLASLMRSAGKPVHIWTVNEGVEARELWGMGVSGIVTDDVRAILNARAELPKTS